MDFSFDVTLDGNESILRPINADDFYDLFNAASDPLIWQQHPNHSLYEEIEFRKYFDGALRSGSAFVVLDKKANRIIGTSRYYDFDLDKKEVVIGYTFLAREFWGTGVNKEIKRLMIDHAFRFVDSVWFHIAKSNMRSCRAVEKLGAVLSHEGKKHSYGREIDYCFYVLRKN